jgi:hypothetical protein
VSGVSDRPDAVLANSSMGFGDMANNVAMCGKKISASTGDGVQVFILVPTRLHLTGGLTWNNVGPPACFSQNELVYSLRSIVADGAPSLYGSRSCSNTIRSQSMRGLPSTGIST